MGNSASFDDCYLSNEEIGQDPEAMAFAWGLIQVQAEQAGVSPSDIELTGIHTDCDREIGCDGPCGGTVEDVDGCDPSPCYVDPDNSDRFAVCTDVAAPGTGATCGTCPPSVDRAARTPAVPTRSAARPASQLRSVACALPQQLLSNKRAPVPRGAAAAAHCS